MCKTPGWPIGAATLFLLLGLTACNGNHGELSLDHPVEDPIFGSLPAEKNVEIGKGYYRHGHFGLAEGAFRQAVERDAGNGEAWLGLAACYDRLGRFDEARRAYDMVIKIAGRTPAVLNNLGYHYFLRGDRPRARETLNAALRADPENEQIRNNLALVNSEAGASPWGTRVRSTEP